MTEPQPRIIAVIEAQRAALLARDTATLQRYVAQWRDVESAIRDSAELLANDMAASARAGKPVSQSKIYQLERYNALLRQTRAQIQDYARQLAPQIEGEQASLWQQGQLDANDQIGAIVGTSFNRLPIDSTNAMIGTTGDGSPLRDTLLRQWPNAVDAITRELLHGVAMGINPRVVARRAALASQASLRQMLTVARTEQLRAYREASRDIYNRSGVVKQYKRLAAKNNRTCILCLADDGKIYKVSEPLPIHPNCRCTSIPIVDGYNITTGKDGAEWFAAQSATTQKQMLGPSRYAMYKDGTPLRAFAGVRNDPVWGKTLQAKTLGDIGKRSTTEPWWLQQNPQLRALGDVLRIDDADVDVVRQHVAELALLPEALHRRVVGAGLLDIHIANKPMPDLDSNQAYKGVHVRGRFSPTWDEIPGAYNSVAKSAVAGAGRHGSASVVLHEYGHAIGDVLGYNKHTKLDAAHRRLYDKLMPYYQQGGIGSVNGQRELLAEGIAQVLIDKKRAIEVFDGDFVEFIESIINGDREVQ